MASSNRPVNLTLGVFNDLEKVRIQGACNMFDRRAVLMQLYLNGGDEGYEWARLNPLTYSELIFNGPNIVGTVEEMDYDSIQSED